MSTECSKHLERLNNKYIEKSASDWTLTRIISRCTVNEILNSSLLYGLVFSKNNFHGSQYVVGQGIERHDFITFWGLFGHT